ncbi:MAG TPA: hypothetical protein VKA08_16790 [Balneolales bacterium]|nr:hypothetical protein [Balneolales bacterium]
MSSDKTEKWSLKSPSDEEQQMHIPSATSGNSSATAAGLPKTNNVTIDHAKFFI